MKPVGFLESIPSPSPTVFFNAAQGDAAADLGDPHR